MLIKVDNELSVQQESDFVKELRNIPELSVDKALEILGGSFEIYEHTIIITEHTLLEDIAKLDGLLESDIKLYSIEVHGIKGVLNNIGAYSLGKKAFELEKLSSERDVVACKKLHPSFCEELTAFWEKLSAVKAQQTDACKSPGDNKRLLLDLPSLLKAADFYDSAMALELLSFINKFTYGDEVDKALQNISWAFEVFDFDKATELTEKLKGAITEDGR